MAFSVSQPGGWFDIPDSTCAAGSVVIEDHLVELNLLIRFAAVCDEYIEAAPARDGDTVQLAASPDDGYNYSRAEALYAWAMQASPNPSTGKNAGGGDLLQWDQWVDQDTGAVKSVVGYYIQGGAESSGTDGLISVLLCCRRGAGQPTAPTVTYGTGGGPAGGGGGVATGGSGGGVVPGGGLGGPQGGVGTGRHKAPASTY